MTRRLGRGRATDDGAADSTSDSIPSTYYPIGYTGAPIGTDAQPVDTDTAPDIGVLSRKKGNDTKKPDEAQGQLGKGSSSIAPIGSDTPITAPDAGVLNQWKKRKDAYKAAKEKAKGKMGGGSSSSNGIVATKQPSNLDHCDEFVVCEGGYVENGDTCAFACDGDCCYGSDACTSFTGQVCKDGNSCSGEKACYYAEIASVVNGCQGDEACKMAGYYGGSLGSVHNSCFFNYACEKAGSYGGQISEIKDSCVGERSCYKMAYYNGVIESVENSCTEGSSSCAFAASGWYGYEGYFYDNYYDSPDVEGGRIERIVNSCGAAYSCMWAASAGGAIEQIQDSCQGIDSCYDIAYRNGGIGLVKSSCSDFLSCLGLARFYGSVGDILYSCEGKRCIFGPNDV